MNSEKCFMCEAKTLLKIKKSNLEDLDQSIKFEVTDDDEFLEKEISICVVCFSKLEESHHNKEFKRCPFCKASGSQIIMPIVYNGSALIICNSCKATGPEVKLTRTKPNQTDSSIEKMAIKEATSLWNQSQDV